MTFCYQEALKGLVLNGCNIFACGEIYASRKTSLIIDKIYFAENFLIKERSFFVENAFDLGLVENVLDLEKLPQSRKNNRFEPSEKKYIFQIYSKKLTRLLFCGRQKYS